MGITNISKEVIINRKDKISLFLLMVAVILSLFVPYGLDGENWIYWFFARILSETGQFIIMERSPLYTIYLLLFNWMDYPVSVVLEYLITASLSMTAFYFFFRHFVSSSISLLISIIWMPFILFHTMPQVQMLALSCSLIAVKYRMIGNARKNIIIFYTFMLLAYLFRPTYQFMIFLFLMRDIWIIITEKILIKHPRLLVPRFSDKPLLLVIILMFCFNIFQSNHRWNNAGCTDKVWSPFTTTSLSGINILSTWSWKYVENKYGSNEGRDYFFTHKELFGDANSPVEAFYSNPSFVISHIVNSVESFVMIVVGTLSLHLSLVMILMIPILLIFYDLLINKKIFSLTIVYFLITCISLAFIIGVIFNFQSIYFIRVFALAAILYGAFRFCNHNSFLEMFTFSSFVLIALTIISSPKNRYMVPFIPIVIISSIWYAKLAKDFIGSLLDKPKRLAIIFGSIGLLIVCIQLISYFIIKGTILPSRSIIILGIMCVVASSLIFILIGCYTNDVFIHKYISRYSSNLRNILPPIFLIIFSSTYIYWPGIVTETFKNLFESDKFQIHSYINDPMMNSYKEINSLLEDCNGIMSYETSFIGAFMDVDINKLYNVYEIPPFGRYNDSDYNGLTLERVDCLLLSNVFNGPPGWYANEKIRYNNYLVPYKNVLLDRGANRFETLFGEAIIYKD